MKARTVALPWQVWSWTQTAHSTATVYGGSGNGVVFQLAPPAVQGGAWTETVLYTFSLSDGSGPIGGLIFDQAGTLYGTTAGAGPAKAATAFKLTPPATTAGPSPPPRLSNL